jgi:hypothetical protein
MDWIKKVVQSKAQNDQLFRALVEKNRLHWKRFSTSEEILKWLHNFSNELEIHCALVLADNILYYNLEEVRYLFRFVLTNKVKIMIMNEKFHEEAPKNPENWFAEYLRTKCLFVSFGRAGKSASSMNYFFQQSHDIDGLTYLELCQFLLQPRDLSKVEKIFLIDDFLGSGKQAMNEWGKKADENDPNSKSLKDVQQHNAHLEFIYLALVGCDVGKKAIEQNLPVKVILGEELDDRFRCFSVTSTVFRDPNLRSDARRIMEEKGRMLYNPPLGYDNMELAVAFNHNTPNNSLPVIWKRTPDGSWYPLFERFE